MCGQEDQLFVCVPHTRLAAGWSCRTLRTLRWPGLTKPQVPGGARRLLCPARLAHMRETASASETAAQFDSVMPNEREASIKLAREAELKVKSLGGGPNS